MSNLNNLKEKVKNSPRTAALVAWYVFLILSGIFVEYLLLGGVVTCSPMIMNIFGVIVGMCVCFNIFYIIELVKQM